jgi:hypothetical protein
MAEENLFDIIHQEVAKSNFNGVYQLHMNTEHYGEYLTLEEMFKECVDLSFELFLGDDLPLNFVVIIRKE